MKHLATKDYPIRASHLPMLITCPWKFLSVYTEPQHLDKASDIDEGSQKAQIGSVCHKMIENWYNGKNPQDYDKAKWPLANHQEAYELFNNYSRDTRNQSKPILVERKVQFTIEPHPSDSTNEPIHIWATIDQVRDEGLGVYKVWDVKTSTYSGFQVLCSSITQIAAYTLAARKELKTKNVEMGGVILVRQYGTTSRTTRQTRNPESQPNGIFYAYAKGSQNIDLILEPIRHKVALLRNGYVYATPSFACTFCFYGGPDQCYDVLEELKSGIERKSLPLVPLNLDFTMDEIS